MTKKYVLIGGLPAFKFIEHYNNTQLMYYITTRVTPKRYFPHLLLHVLQDFERLSFIFLFILFRINQQTACGAPVCWSKYTTAANLLKKLMFTYLLSVYN